MMQIKISFDYTNENKIKEKIVNKKITSTATTQLI